MKNLLDFIWRHYFFFLFLLLEAIAGYLIVQNNFYQRSVYFNSSNALTGKMYEARSEVNYYLGLKDENEKLAAENARLRSQLLNSFVNYNSSEIIVNDTVYKKKYVYTHGRVVNNSTNRRNNYLTIDRGRLQGVEKDMAVISPTGIVGSVISVSDNFSTVMSVLHKDTRVNVQTKKEGVSGSMSWEGTDYRYATITDMPTHARLKPGDTIVTSHLSVTYPQGILAGTVEKFEVKSGDNAYTVKVKLSTDFRKVHYVHLVKNIMREEQLKLEGELPKDGK